MKITERDIEKAVATAERLNLDGIVDVIAWLRCKCSRIEAESAKFEAALDAAKESIDDLKSEVAHLQMGEVNLLTGMEEFTIEDSPSVADSLVHPLDERFASQPWNRK